MDPYPKDVYDGCMSAEVDRTAKPSPDKTIDLPERMVYVDDDMDMRNIVKETMRRALGEDHVFVTCGSGKEFLKRYNELQPDLVLLDLSMPEMDGPDVIEAMLKRKVAGEAVVSIIFITGKGRIEMQENYKHIDVLGVVHKPFDVNGLAGEIEKLWAQRNF